MQIRATHLLRVWLLAFLGSLVIQSVFQWWFAEVTIWGRNIGWQTEIAIWNAGVSLILFRLLREPEPVQAAAIPGLVLLSTLFGTNHLQAALSQPNHFGNWLGATLNLSGVALAVAYYVQQRRAR